jgi:hypothetical protein
LHESISDGEPNQAWIGQLFFSNGLDDNRRRDIFAQRLANREEYLAALEEKYDFLAQVIDAEVDEIRLLTLEARLHQTRAEIDWLVQTIDNI